MQVYVVTENFHDYDVVKGVFSTHEKADQAVVWYAAHSVGHTVDHYAIDEQTLDLI